MSKSSAERWIVISAVVTAAVYFYRVTLGGSSSSTTATAPRGLKGIVSGKPPAPLGQFATAWGFTYLVLALMGEAAPGLGGAFAILIMAGDLLANAPDVLGKVTTQEGAVTSSGSKAATTVTPTTVQLAGNLNTPGGLHAATNIA